MYGSTTDLLSSGVSLKKREDWALYFLMCCVQEEVKSVASRSPACVRTFSVAGQMDDSCTSAVSFPGAFHTSIVA